MPWSNIDSSGRGERLHEELKMAKSDDCMRILQGLLVFGNVVIGMCGIALTAECIYFVSDPHGLYPLLEATENNDIHAAAWIGIFVGFALFALSILGIIGIIKSDRTLLLVYIILMLITFAFEMASCITAATHRDFLTPNLFLKQMLERYQNSKPANNNDKMMIEGVTKTWDKIMLQNHCCGVLGPSDWQEYTSAFRVTHSDADFPWPRKCCAMDEQGLPISLDGCKLGVPGYYNSNIPGSGDSHLCQLSHFTLSYIYQKLHKCPDYMEGISEIYSFVFHWNATTYAKSAITYWNAVKS
ncbi:Uroplakin-1b [Willisornis vidua]|uniref:Uroplakin-1b n=1 Tax=Willisornis vidua TaxID=1566151 RepID=A0ABQ9DEN2_9PASS|nr:Uroplakin-1b [Willisornis vidua]